MDDHSEGTLAFRQINRQANGKPLGGRIGPSFGVAFELNRTMNLVQPLTVRAVSNQRELNLCLPLSSDGFLHDQTAAVDVQVYDVAGSGEPGGRRQLAG